MLLHRAPMVRYFPVWPLVFALFLSISPRAGALQSDPVPVVLPSGPATNKSQEGPREQTIYIPYGKLRDVFEKEGRGVFLPYDKFQELWNAAREKANGAVPAPPPIDALISEALNDATVEKEVVKVESKLTIELFKKGWNQIPLRLSDSAILSAKIDGLPAKIVSKEDGSYTLLVFREDPKPSSIQLELVYAHAFSKSPGKNSVQFDAPQAPVNRWRIVIPESGVKIQVQPMLAATDVPSDKSSDTDKTAGSTILQAFVGAAPQVRIEWTPRSEGAAGLKAIANVQSQQEVFVEEGVVRTRATLQYSISRAEMNDLQIDVATDQKIVNVFDPNIRKWDVEKRETGQRLSIQLFEPAKQSQQVTIELERFQDASLSQEITIAPIQAIDVGRQVGVVVVRVGSGLRSEPTLRTSLLQMDLSELPESMRTQSWTYAYRYAALPFQLSISVEKVIPKQTVKQLVEAILEPTQWTIHSTTIHTIEQAGLFQLEFDLPQGFDVRSVRGKEMPNVPAAPVDSHLLTGDNKTRLVVNLGKKALGTIGIEIDLFKKIEENNLVSPTGTAANLTLLLPHAVDATIERATGSFILYSPESLRIIPTQRDGVRDISVQEALQGMTRSSANSPTLQENLAFAYGDKPVSLGFSVERRKPFVSVRQLLTARVESGNVKFNATFFYDIRYSGVKNLRIDLPAAIAADVRNLTPTARETPIANPTDLQEGYVAWSFSGETEWIGSPQIQLSWERKLGNLEIGKTIEVSLPRLIPKETDRAWGQIVLSKAESLDIQPSTGMEGLRPIDPQYDLMSGTQVPDATRGFEFQGDWKLDFNATRYALEEVKRTSIERAFLRMVTTRSKQIGLQAMYRIRSARQRLAISLPAKLEFDSQPLRINGVPVPLERGNADEYFIPLAGRKPDEPFLVELRYTTEGTFQQLDFPTFPEDPAEQKAYVGVYLPDEIALLGSRGPWTEEFDWSKDRDGKMVPASKKSEAELIGWLTEGIRVIDSPAFQKDGLFYLYSSLAPESPPDGSLRLVAIHNKWLSGILFGSLALIGLLLLSQTWRIRLAALMVVFATIALLGFFVPTLANQVWSLPLFAAAGLTALLWGTRYCLADLPRHFRHFSDLASGLMRRSNPPMKEAPVFAPASDSIQVRSEQDQGGANHE